MSEEEITTLKQDLEEVKKKLAETHHFATVMVNAMCQVFGMTLRAGPTGVDCNVIPPGGSHPHGLLGQLIHDVQALKDNANGEPILLNQSGQRIVNPKMN